MAGSALKVTSQPEKHQRNSPAPHLADSLYLGLTLTSEICSDHDDITMAWKGDRLNLVPSDLPPGSGSLCRASSHSLPRLRAGSMEYLKPVPNEETFKRMMFFKHVVDHVAHVHDIAPFICCSCF
jgi:hypothetical protein